VLLFAFVLQTSLLGSILSNCLLVLGMAFALGGMKNKVQTYNQNGAHMLSSLLLLASIALVLPAAFVNSFSVHPSMAQLLHMSRITALIMFVIYGLYLFFQLVTHSEMFEDEMAAKAMEAEEESVAGDDEQQESSPLIGTYVTAVKKGSKRINNPQQQRQQPKSGANGIDVPSGGTHSHGYQASSSAEDGGLAANGDGGDDGAESDSEPVESVSESMHELGDLLPGHSPSTTNRPLPSSIAEDEEHHSSGASNGGSGRSSGRGSSKGSGSRAGGSGADGVQINTNTDVGNGGGGNVQGDADDECDCESEEDDEDLPKLTLFASSALLLLVTITVAISSEFLVDSIEAVTRKWDMNLSFVGGM
jgi:Ca2+/H+ antiporter